METDRYQSLNLTNLDKSKKTVEFRMFAGTINPELIVTAAYMCVSMVASVSRSETVVTSQNLGILDKARAFASHYWGKAANLILSEGNTDDVQSTLFNQVSLASPYFAQ